MKLKNWFIALTLMFASTPVYAGVFGTVKSYVATEAWSLVIGAIIGALGMLGVSWKLWGKVAKESGDFIWAIYRATRKNSEGGISIVQTEMKDILKEGAEVIPAAQKAIASHKK